MVLDSSGGVRGVGPWSTSQKWKTLGKTLAVTVLPLLTIAVICRKCQNHSGAEHTGVIRAPPPHCPPLQSSARRTLFDIDTFNRQPSRRQTALPQ